MRLDWWAFLFKSRQQLRWRTSSIGGLKKLTIDPTQEGLKEIFRFSSLSGHSVKVDGWYHPLGGDAFFWLASEIGRAIWSLEWYRKMFNDNISICSSIHIVTDNHMYIYIIKLDIYNLDCIDVATKLWSYFCWAPEILYLLIGFIEGSLCRRFNEMARKDYHGWLVDIGDDKLPNYMGIFS